MKKLLTLGVFSLTVAVLLGIDPIIHNAFAGTGGTEVNAVWDFVKNGLQGTWGKILAAIFIGFAILAAKGGNGIATIIFAAIAFIIGSIPTIVESGYSGTF